MPCLVLYGFSDTEAQALALSPDFYNTTMIVPSSDQTQPIWPHVILVGVYPDARKYLKIEADACGLVDIDTDASFDAHLYADADVFIEDDAFADVLLAIAQDAQARLEAEEPEADIVLNISAQAQKYLTLQQDGDALLGVRLDADHTVAEPADSDVALRVSPDACKLIEIDASDTMESEACDE